MRPSEGQIGPHGVERIEHHWFGDAARVLYNDRLVATVMPSAAYRTSRPRHIMIKMRVTPALAADAAISRGTVGNGSMVFRRPAIGPCFVKSCFATSSLGDLASLIDTPEWPSRAVKTNVPARQPPAAESASRVARSGPEVRKDMVISGVRRNPIIVNGSMKPIAARIHGNHAAPACFSPHSMRHCCQVLDADTDAINDADTQRRCRSGSGGRPDTVSIRTCSVRIADTSSRSMGTHRHWSGSTSRISSRTGMFDVIHVYRL